MRTEHKWALVAVIILIAVIAYIISVSGAATEQKGELPFENRNTPPVVSPAAPITVPPAGTNNRSGNRDRAGQGALNLNGAAPRAAPPDARSPFLPPLAGAPANTNSAAAMAANPPTPNRPTATTDQPFSSGRPIAAPTGATQRPITASNIPPSAADSPPSFTPPSTNPPREVATAPRRGETNATPGAADPTRGLDADATGERLADSTPALPAANRPGSAVPIPAARQPDAPRDELTTLISPSGAAAGTSAYTIKEADTLSGIARERYGDDKHWRAIVAANPGLNPDRIVAGKTIVLPAREDVLAGNVKPASAGKQGTAPQRNSPQSGAPQSGAPQSGAGVPARTAAATPTSESGLVRDADSWTGAIGTGANGNSNSTRQPRLAADGARTARATYKVGTGDTLISIARDVLKNEDRWRDIWDLNKDRLKSPDVIPLGFELKLPERETARADTKKNDE